MLMITRCCPNREILLVACLISGCSSTQTFFPSAFRSADAPYEIPYSDPKRRALLGSGWRVVNYKYDETGPADEKTKGDFESTISWEFADGRRGTISTTTYELLLEHTSNATIWVRLLPMPISVRRKNVRTIAENYVNNLAGSVLTDFVSDTIEGGRISIKEKRISTKILSSTSTRLLGREAQVVQFEVVNLDQLEHNPDAPRTKGEIVLIPTLYSKGATGIAGGRVSANLLFGYANDEEEFDKYYYVFQKFVKSARVYKRK